MPIYAKFQERLTSAHQFYEVWHSSSASVWQIPARLYNAEGRKQNERRKNRTTKEGRTEQRKNKEKKREKLKLQDRAMARPTIEELD